MQIKQPATITIAGVFHLEVTGACSIPFLGQLRNKMPNANYLWIVVDLLLLQANCKKIEQHGQTANITIQLEPKLHTFDLYRIPKSTRSVQQPVDYKVDRHCQYSLSLIHI